jgi:uncharacterized membrane protein YsdA (DUF1294 family)
MPDLKSLTNQSAPMLHTAWMLACSLLTFLLYALDKRKAATGAWRIPERTLHLLALLGGFAGGFAGRALFRHKTQKPIFLVVLVAAGIAHTALLIWLLRHS